MSMLGKKKRRPLTTVEMRGTTIQHKKVGTKGKITGSYPGGFVVRVPKEKKSLRLPFSNIKDWDVVGKPRKQRKK